MSRTEALMMSAVYLVATLVGLGAAGWLVWEAFHCINSWSAELAGTMAFLILLPTGFMAIMASGYAHVAFSRTEKPKREET